MPESTILAEASRGEVPAFGQNHESYPPYQARFPLGFIDDALKTDIVTEVGNQVQISNDISNFLPAVELGTPTMV